jgi:anti-sigma factor ChrR (cupin superfamily)
MTDRVAAHEMTDVAALYALGALSQHEARSFEEHLGEGCDICQAELESFEQTVRAVAFGIAEAEPPARVRAELLAKVSKSVAEQTGESVPTGDLGQFVSILASEGKWRELREGVLLKKLHVDQATGIATSLVRMLPGTALPCHQHLGVEQFFVIEGDCNVAGQRLTSGDYHRAEAGSIHETTYTVDGTLFLLIAPERYEVLDAR